MAEIVQGVTIKIKTEGASSVDGLSNSLGGATRAAGAAAGAANTATSALGNMGGAANNAARGVNNAGGAAGGAASQFSAFGRAVAENLFPQLFKAGVLANLTADAIKKLAETALEVAVGLVKMYAGAVREGIEFNALVQTSILGVASLLSTFGTFADAQGRAATGVEAFAAAQQVSKGMIEQVRIATLETTATFPEMLRALQEGMPSALRAGFDTTQVVAFSKAMAQAAGAIGMPIDQLGQEFRGVFDVDLSKNSRIARMLFAGMGASADELRSKMNAMTATERFDFLMSRLQAFGATGEAVSRTYTGALSNLKDAFTQIMGEAMVGATNELTTTILALSDSLLVVGANGKKAFDPQLVEAIRETWRGVNDLYSVMNTLSGLFLGYSTDADTLFAGLGEAIQDALTVLKEFAETYANLKRMAASPTESIWAWMSPGVAMMKAYAEAQATVAKGMGPLQFPELQFGPSAEALGRQAINAMHAQLAGVQEASTTGFQQTLDRMASQYQGFVGELKEPEKPGGGYTFTPFTGQVDDADYAEKLESMNAQLTIQVKMAEAAGVVNDIERARLMMKVDMFKADKAALEIIHHISDKASDAQRAEAMKLADQTRAVGYRQAEATFARKVGEEAERAGKEQQRHRDIALRDLEKIRVKHEEALALMNDQTTVERQIQKLLSDREEELQKIAVAAKAGLITSAEAQSAWDDTLRTYTALVNDVTADSLREFHAGLAREQSQWIADYESDIRRAALANAEDTSRRGIELLDKMRAAANAAAIGFAQSFSTQLTDALDDVAQTGGKNLGQIAGDTFSALVNAGASLAMQQLMKGVVKLFGDDIKETADGKYAVGGKVYDDFSDAVGSTKGGRALQTGVAFVGAAFNGYQQGQAGEGGRTAGAIAGASAGASVGGPYAFATAIVGAIVGYVGAVLGEKQRQEEYKYGIPGVTAGGEAFFTANNRNMNPEEIQRAITATQETYNAIRNAYAKVFVILGSVMPEIGAIDGKFQDNPSSKYLKHLDEWLTGTLPREIATRVEGALLTALGDAGMSWTKSLEFLDAARLMDPAKAAQFWQEMATGLMSWHRAAEAMAAINSVFEVDPIQGDGGLIGGRDKFANGRVQHQGESDFAAASRTAAEGLFRIGREMVNMTGPDRVAAFAAMGAGVESLALSLQEFLNQVASSVKSVRQIIADTGLAHDLDRADTPQKKADILYGELTNIELQLKRAVELGLSPADIERLTSRGAGILNQIYQLDPTAEMSEWFNRQLSNLEGWSISALDAVAQRAVDQVTAILTSLDPFRQWFLGLPVDLQTAWDALDTSIMGAVTALDELSVAILAAIPDPGNGDDDEDDEDDGGQEDDPKKPTLDKPMSASYTTTNHITVVIPGTIFGVPDLERQVIGAVQEAMRRNPDSFESPI